jgi:hypothetical protein
MRHILILLTVLLSMVTLLLVSAVVRAHTEGAVDGGSEFSEIDLEWYLDWGSEHAPNRPVWPVVLVLAKDTWVAATNPNAYAAKGQALSRCRHLSASPSSCKIVDVNRESDFIKKKLLTAQQATKSASTLAANSAASSIDIEKECFELFHGPKRGSTGWEGFIWGNYHTFLNRGDCDQFVSEDYSIWIAPLPSKSQEQSSQENQVVTIETTKAVEPPEPQSPKAVASQPTEADKNIELEFWQSIKDGGDSDMYRAYLRQFPSGIYAELAKIKIKKLGGDTTVVNASIPNLDYGDYYALVIGNNDYQDLTNLRSAVNDAKVVSTVLEVDYGFNVKLLENASRKDILRSLKHLRETVSAKDNVLIYYAGHGYLDEAADQGYWLPVDSERDDDSNWIPTDRVASQVKAMKAKHVMVVADSCFSGTITRAIKIEQRTPEWLSEIVKKKARTALTSGGLEPVMDTGSGNHSAFAYAFISLLEENDGVLDASQLFSKLRPKVMVNSTQTPQYGKIHMAGDDGGDFLFVRR